LPSLQKSPAAFTDGYGLLFPRDSESLAEDINWNSSSLANSAKLLLFQFIIIIIIIIRNEQICVAFSHKELQGHVTKQKNHKYGMEVGVISRTA